MREKDDVRQSAGIKRGAESAGPVYPSPARLLFLVVTSIFSVEIAYMLFLHRFLPLSPFQEALLDASTLVLLVTPALYFFIYRPFVIHIEEHKKSGEALRGSEEQFRGIFDYSKVGVNVLGPDYKYMKVNRAFCDMIGYSEKELLAHDFKGITHPGDIEPNLVLSKKLRAGEIDFFHLEKRYIHKNGGIVWGDLTASSVRAEDGTLRYVIAIIQDITERKEAEQALLEAKEKAEEATRLKDKFVALVSHDLKTPLTSMIGFLKLVRHDGAEPLNEGAKLILDRGIESGRQMVSLIDDLLTISRFKTGQLKLNKQFFDARYLGAKMAADYSHLARQKGIKMENAIPENSRIYGDKTLLAEAVQNLVTNAIKFCSSGDRITISLAAESPSTVCVRDTGPGIQPDLLKHIFDYDKKTSTPGTAGEIGTGFGLPLVKDIIELHGGDLEVDCTPGNGCLFCLKLPHVSPKILLVDDDRNFRYLQILLLKDMNATIIEAENGEEALDMMAAVRPHLIITDIKMPVMDGLELLRNVKGRPDMADIPVIAVSGEFGMEIRDTVFKLGADDFITKKIDKVDFLPRVRRFIG
ncbi:MAG: PAS domain S-box protein [Nitrospinae bacterium]|nr:PAS domain S-box protein [Nitrospinota bacterium]